ncbi:hypothetical protein H0A36_13035 [Endozoicomonas sp. SM1973]|uniref:DUF4239 domain-containing protein n=1 Tax=Spartinivicinus marinus TaxID=2994442 RepID=A0A853I2W5_9GAMM|nr:hypothetical protein [Spartinivicinus marinus]MCX4029680.1 hypothetical protein [Spartinivicinus marinus]NYZ66939.1 hypothetical protein [Spartinivicinus marinus]
MREVMYDQSSLLICSILFISMALCIEMGDRIGRSKQGLVNESSKAQVNTIQNSLLGLLALLLGFTFSLSLQRFDSRSNLVVDEANTISTTYLRTQLLPPAVRKHINPLLIDYLNIRVQVSSISLVDNEKRKVLSTKATQIHNLLWLQVKQAAEQGKNYINTRLFIESLNLLIDIFSKRSAELNRHVPELVLFILYGTFLMTGSIVGYASGVTGNRVPFVTYIMVAMIVLLVFIIIDLDRPKRGIIKVNQNSLIELQASMPEMN